MLAAVALVLPFVASTLGYMVLTPNSQVGWTTQGAQPLTWTRVSTDPTSFTIVLTNQQINGFSSQILASQVDGTSGSMQLSPPSSGGFPTGVDFRIDLVASSQELDTILAQSGQFNITQSTSTLSSSGTSTGTTTTATSASTASSSGISDSPISTGTTPSSTSSDSSSTNLNPTTSSSAASSYPVQTGLLAIFSLLGFALA